GARARRVPPRGRRCRTPRRHPARRRDDCRRAQELPLRCGRSRAHGERGAASAVTREELRDVLDFAVEVAWRAGRATLAHYQTGIAAETKPDDTPVTTA